MLHGLNLNGDVLFVKHYAGDSWFNALISLFCILHFKLFNLGTSIVLSAGLSNFRGNMLISRTVGNTGKYQEIWGKNKSLYFKMLGVVQIKY